MKTNDLSFLKKPLEQYIDHTLLKPDVTNIEFIQFLENAQKYNFASVCVPPYLAIYAKCILNDANSHLKVCTVIGFPHGNIPTVLKSQQVQYFAERGIDELDFVINLGFLKSNLIDKTIFELQEIDRICKEQNTLSKCIVETCYITNKEKNLMYELLSLYSNIDYIKTSTGYGKHGAKLGDVMQWNIIKKLKIELQNANVLNMSSNTSIRTKPSVKIKAAGGIRDLDTALEFIKNGADRLGLSASITIMEEYQNCKKVLSLT